MRRILFSGSRCRPSNRSCLSTAVFPRVNDDDSLFTVKLGGSPSRPGSDTFVTGLAVNRTTLSVQPGSAAAFAEVATIFEPRRRALNRSLLPTSKSRIGKDTYSGQRALNSGVALPIVVALSCPWRHLFSARGSTTTRLTPRDKTAPS
jgi:hypothetical protein